jgi:hypothetical protein
VGLIAVARRSAPLLLLLLAAVSARAADPNAEVDAIIKKAVELRRQGKDRDALAELQRATSIAKPPRLSAQLGLAEQALGLWAAAEKDLKTATSEGGDPWIKKHRGTLDESLKFIDGKLATLDVWGSPDGAEILIDGEAAGTFPLASPLRVAAGTVQLIVRAKGFAPSTRTLDLAAGANEREHVVLLAQDATPPVAAEPPAGAAVPTIATTPQPASEEEHGGITSRWWFWTLAGLVVAGGVAGVLIATHKSGTSCPATDMTCSSW